MTWVFPIPIQSWNGECTHHGLSYRQLLFMPDTPINPATFPFVAVIGPTASGKTRLGVHLARQFDGEIVSLDSRQLYQGLDLGTGKDLAEYAATQAGQSAVRHHLIDVAGPNEELDLFRVLRLAHTAILDINARNRLPIAVGGTALYLKALLDGYELPGTPPDPILRSELELLADAEIATALQQEAPDLYARADKANRRRMVRALEIARVRARGAALATGNNGRTDEAEMEGECGDVSAAPSPLPMRTLLLAPYYPRPELHRRIERRLDERLAAGMIDEVAALHAAGVSWERLEFFGLEYRHLAFFLQGKMTRTEMRDKLLVKIRNFCRAQEIWLRKLEREGWVIHWLPEGDFALADALVEKFLRRELLPPPILQIKDILYGPKHDRHGMRI